MSEVVIFVRDFELGTRIAKVISANGKEPVFPAGQENFENNISEETQLLILDLNDDRYKPIELIGTIRKKYPDLPVIGFLSQVQKRLHNEAREAGCAWVLPRSSFVKNLSTILEKGGKKNGSHEGGI